MIVKSEEFKRYSNYIYIFGTISFSLKYLSIKKFALIELNDGSDISSVIGAIFVITFYSTLALFGSFLRDYFSTIIHHTRESLKLDLPDFSAGNTNNFGFCENLHHTLSRAIFYLDTFVPIIFGSVISILTYKDFLHMVIVLVC